ncbi:MAG: MSMEG_1061 family FMN-dependent PPOX-type flavoprotein [Alphaproteobacteria bacterium]
MTIETEDALRDHYPAQSKIVRLKTLPAIDKHIARFISLSPFLVIGSNHPDRGTDVSPRGDAPGFVKVIDPTTVMIPDRPGNNRLDTLSNITVNADVGLVFMIPGVEETVRVNGRARIVTEIGQLQAFAVDGKTPPAAILIDVKEAYLHCAKALKRSRLWQDDYRIDRGELPTLGKMVSDQVNGEISVEDAEAGVEISYRDRMY